MPLVHVKEDETFENALRRFKRKCEKSGILSELKGFLLITGVSESDKEGKKPPYQIRFWDGVSSDTKVLGDFKKGPGKPEGLLVLKETAEKYSVIVLFDGAPKSQPTQFEISKI